MRGWRALTLGWDRPIRACAATVRPEIPSLPRPRRDKLIPDDVRKVLYELEQLSQKARAEISRVFAERGLNKKQQANHMRLIRRDRG